MTQEKLELCDEFGRPIVIEVAEEVSLMVPFVALALICMTLAGFWIGINIKAWTRTENPAFGTARVNADTVAAWQPALADAVAEWRRALPGWTIEIPTLVADKDNLCGVSTETVPIACAVRGDYKIYIARDQTLYDHKTIMMHELAHLFGVPHIERDELMDATYQGKLDKPTAMAIVIAEYKLKHQ